jgi:ribosomal-protein-alanine N-acetyltransferase
MAMEDLDAIWRIEKEIYPFPWTKGNFRDSIYAGYSCWVYEERDQVIGYAVMMLAAGEANLLNLAISRTSMGKGRGKRFLLHLVDVARGYRADTMLLEVRPSNLVARRLYEKVGFDEIAVRRNYYPATQGREDAILMGIAL